MKVEKSTELMDFMTNAKKKYGTERVWKMFSEVFFYLPLAAIVENAIFCLHGGLSPSI